MATISIIIPAYNAERTIERAVNTVLSQTLRDIELWVVDDGSKDSTGAILDRLAQQDSRLKVIHQENAGAFAARLNGIKHCTGTYFGFLDADDHIEPQMYERMTSFAIENDLDVVQCDLFGASSVGRAPELFLSREEVLEKVIKPRLVRGEDSMLVWDKIYKNQYDASKWPIENYWTGEDYVFNWRFFIPVNRVGYLHEGFYHYTITPSSSTRKFNAKTIPGMMATIRMRDMLAKEYGFNPTDYDFSAWVTKCMRNVFFVAASAPAPSFRERLLRARAVLNCDVLKEALDNLGDDGCKRDRNARFLTRCGRLPVWLSVLLIFVPKKTVLCLRDIRNRGA